jgi:putative lipoprotein
VLLRSAKPLLAIASSKSDASFAGNSQRFKWRDPESPLMNPSLRSFFGICVVPVLLTGCAGLSAAPEGGAATGGRVTGTVTYRERIALPPTAVIKVQLVDVSRADAAAVVLGEQTFAAGGKQVPFAFEIPYDPAKIEPNHSYAVGVRIEEAGKLRFINDQRYAVITHGAPAHVDMVLRAVGGPVPR